MSHLRTPYSYGIRARNSLWATFFLMGVVSMGWVPRIPEIKEAIGLTNTQLGLVFIGSTSGAVLGAQLAGRLIHTFATQRVISFAVLVMPLGLVGMGLAQNFVELFIALFIALFAPVFGFVSTVTATFVLVAMLASASIYYSRTLSRAAF